VLKYLQAVPSCISSNIHLFLTYHNNHRISKIPKLLSLLCYIGYIWEMASADYTNMEIYEVTYKGLIKHAYHSSSKVNSIPQMLRWEMQRFHIKLKVCILLHIVKSDPLWLKVDICRDLLGGDSLTSNIVSTTSFIPRINSVMSKHSMIATQTFPDSISILELINTLTSYYSTFQADTSSRLELQTSRSHPSCILCQLMYQAISVTITIQQHSN